MDISLSQTSVDQAKLAHDLRNTLSAMYNYMQILQFSLAQLELTKEEEIAQKVIEEIHILNTRINEGLGGVSERP